MAVFPLFVDLKGKKCIIIGGGRVAERKINVLLEFDPDITVISPAVIDNINNLHARGAINLISDRYHPKYLAGTFLVIAATSDNQLNEIIYRDATTQRIPVNVVDAPDKCTFIFPSIVQRNELVIGISTSGSFPALSKKIREKIEQGIPTTYRNLMEVLKECRERASLEMPDPEGRSNLLNQIAAELVSGNVTTPEQLRQIINDKFREYTHEEEN